MTSARVVANMYSRDFGALHVAADATPGEEEIVNDVTHLNAIRIRMFPALAIVEIV